MSNVYDEIGKYVLHFFCVSEGNSLKMVRMNSLADALRCINNAEKRGKRQVQ